ncbi:MAG: glycine cleavage system protein GcvH [Planctomycetota bacterium]
MRPDDLRYLESHEWVRLQDGMATIGITDYAVEHLNDLVFLDLPSVGDEVTRGESFGEIESVKAVSELYSPVSGEVVEVNEPLKENLDQLAQDAFGGGWMIKVKASDPSELESLLDAAAYEKVLEKE